MVEQNTLITFSPCETPIYLKKKAESCLHPFFVNFPNKEARSDMIQLLCIPWEHRVSRCIFIKTLRSAVIFFPPCRVWWSIFSTCIIFSGFCLHGYIKTGACISALEPTNKSYSWRVSEALCWELCILKGSLFLVQSNRCKSKIKLWFVSCTFMQKF